VLKSIDAAKNGIEAGASSTTSSMPGEYKWLLLGCKFCVYALLSGYSRASVNMESIK
jgi:hypothetical protein